MSLNISSWIKASRLQTLPLSLAGIILGSFIAKSNGFWNFKIFLLACITTILLQVLSNFANDFGDGVKGTDNLDRIGPKRMIATGAISINSMKNAIISLSILSLLSVLILIYLAFDNFLFSIIFFVLGIISVIAAIKYTIGKNAYGYSGFGDIFVFVFFGILAVIGSYFLQSKHLEIYLILPAVGIGMLCVSVLNLNNMRDINSDKKAGKNTIVVKIGLEKAKKYHLVLVTLPFVSLNIFCIIFESYYALLFNLLFVVVVKHLQIVFTCQAPEKLNPELKKMAIITFLVSVIIAFGISY